MAPLPPDASLSDAELFDAHERSRIVQAARALYLHQGIAGVTMADIARYLRIPEHAVRRWFPSVELLVISVVAAHVAAVQAELSSYRGRYTTAVEELLVLRNWVSTELRASIGPFFEQLEAHYPSARQQWHDHLAGFPQEHLRANLREGVRQGLYHPGLDVENEVRGWFERVRAIRTAKDTKSDAADLHYALFNAFLASLVTPAGALVARRLQEAAPYY